MNNDFWSLAGTSALNSSQKGYSIGRDNRNSQSSTNMFRAGFAPGDGSGVKQSILADNEFPDGVGIYTTRHKSSISPNHDAHRNSSLIGSDDESFSYPSGDPENPFRVGGNLGGSGAYYNGLVGEILIYQTRHDNTTRVEIENHLADKWVS